MKSHLTFSALLGSASANGFQMVVNGASPKAMEDFKVVNIQVSFDLSESAFHSVHSLNPKLRYVHSFTEGLFFMHQNKLHFMMVNQEQSLRNSSVHMEVN